MTSVTELTELFYVFATEDFNAWSQHFATNVVVIPSKDFTSAKMTSGGGEWASLEPEAPYEQTTISNWHLTWVWLEMAHQDPTIISVHIGNMAIASLHSALLADHIHYSLNVVGQELPQKKQYLLAPIAHRSC